MVRENIEVIEQFDSPGYSRVDRIGFRQIFANLITNARDAIRPRGKGRIVLSIRKEEGTTVVSVADDGIGIAKEDQKTVFFPFFSTKGGWGTGEERTAGQGLGLSVAYNLVREHGGRMILESTKGEGSVIYIRLPSAGKE